MSDQFGPLFERSKGGDQACLGRLLSLVDEMGPTSLREACMLRPQRRAFRLGLTGAPGVGKSTLLAGLIDHLCGRGFKVAVLAIDPSSPFSQGALLGDRLRFADRSSKWERIFFARSLGSRGNLGGVAASAFLMARVFDAIEFDFVIVETVGVGQSEIDIVHLADRTALVLNPCAGDSVQLIKAGIQEIGDLIIVNKSDLEGAESLIQELKIYREGSPIFSTVATRGEGVDKVAQWIVSQRDFAVDVAFRNSVVRLRGEAGVLLRRLYEQEIQRQVAAVETVEDLEVLFQSATVSKGGNNG